MPTFPNIILLHGALGSASTLSALAKELKDFARPIIYEFSGHGASPSTEHSFAIEGMKLELREWMREHKLEGAPVFGYSMGGYVAMCLAKQEPDLFESVRTLGTKYLWTEEYAQKESARLNPDLLLQKVPAFARELEARHVYTPWTEVLQKTKELMLNLGANPCLTLQDFTQIHAPISIAMGDRDNTLTIDEYVQIYQALSHGSLMVIPGCPHPFDRAPLMFIKEWLRKAI